MAGSVGRCTNDRAQNAAHHAEAAEAAVAFLEQMFETSGGHPYLAGRFGRRADRERRRDA